jgi:enoyl-CoA hydratase/carnithine racemase
MTDAQAGVPFAAGPLELMRHALSPELLRPLTLTRAVLSMRQRLESRIIDELCAVDDLKSRSLVQAKNLAAQPALRSVKRQIRGGLAQRVSAGLCGAGPICRRLWLIACWAMSILVFRHQRDEASLEFSKR